MSTHTKLAIIGSGPAGYTAGVYAARAKLAPTNFTGIKSGGQLMWTTEVENFPGFVEGINGPKLMMTMRAQAEKFGTQMVDKFVTAVDFSAKPFKLWTSFPADQNPDDAFTYQNPDQLLKLMAEIKKQPADYTADAVIVTTGAIAIPLGIKGERELMGRGVSVCAVCDAAFFQNKKTFVIGGGDAAMEDTLALTKFAAEVTVIHRREQFKASKIMADRVLNHPKVKVLWNTEVVEVMGNQKVEGIKIKTGDQVNELAADGVFVAIGHKPMTAIFRDQAWIDDHGYIVTSQSGSWQGIDLATRAKNERGLVDFPTMTSVPGVFAAGDAVDVRYKQAISSAGQGCMAAIDAERWLEAAN